MITALLADLPLDLSDDEARRLLREELSKPIYHRGESLFERLTRWLQGFPGDLAIDGRAPWVVVAFAALVGILALILVLAGPIRGSARIAGPTAVLADSQLTTAKQARARAEEWARSGHWSEAAIDCFRALVLLLAERELIGPPEGQTAHEVVAGAQTRLPDQAGPLAAGARAFDLLIYGRRPATQAAYHQMADLYATTSKAKPAPESRTP